jgi:gluconate 5-dehydrogenase
MANVFDVAGKVVLVTGSSRGLGLTFANGFADAGATVIINSRHEDAVQATVKAIRKRGGKAGGCAFDVADSAQVKEKTAAVMAEYGAIDVLVNNAGIHRRAPLEELTEEDWKKVVDVNLNAVFVVSQHAARGMIARKQGKIINISSLNSWGARPTIANYCAAKGGLNALTRSMATEWGKYNIQTNAIAPGYFLTDLTRPLAEDAGFDSWVKSEVPLGRWGDPKELVGTAIYLASEASDYVNGHILYVDGGWSACL